MTALVKQLPLAERAAVIPILEQLAQDVQAFVRWNLAFALGEIGHEDGIRVLERLVEDEHANVRFRVALALALIGHGRSIPTLEKLAADTYQIGAHYTVRAFAALALGRFRQEAAWRAVSRLVEDEDPVVHWHAAVALGDIGLPDGVELLAELVSATAPTSFFGSLPVSRTKQKTPEPRASSGRSGALSSQSLPHTDYTVGPGIPPGHGPPPPDS